MIFCTSKSNHHIIPIVFQCETRPLCEGDLILDIDGEIVMFDDKENPRFWTCNGRGRWIIDVDKLPDKYKKYASEIAEEFGKFVRVEKCKRLWLGIF